MNRRKDSPLTGNPRNGKGPRFAAMAIRHYIAVLEAARGHCFDEQSFFDNDIGLYKSILTVLEEDRWPSNAMYDLPPDQLADALDAAHAEIARLNVRLVALTGQLHAERITGAEDLARARAEIAQLRTAIIQDGHPTEGDYPC